MVCHIQCSGDAGDSLSRRSPFHTSGTQRWACLRIPRNPRIAAPNRILQIRRKNIRMVRSYFREREVPTFSNISRQKRAENTARHNGDITSYNMNAESTVINALRTRYKISEIKNRIFILPSLFSQCGQNRFKFREIFRKWKREISLLIQFIDE